MDFDEDDEPFFKPFVSSTASSPPFSEFGSHSPADSELKRIGLLGTDLSWEDQAAILAALGDDDEDAGIGQDFTSTKGGSSSAGPIFLKSLVPASESYSGNGASGSGKHGGGMSLVDPQWEIIDPTPDIWSLFNQFNKEFFWSKLTSVEVKWSKQMTSCAGICRYQSRAGYCSIGLSFPLLKFRPRKDLVETLLHEMIHAYLFVSKNDRDRESHGPFFHEHMFRINKQTGTTISVYHSFHDEVNHYKQHIWRCEGPCRDRKPYCGFVKRARNRAPSKNDLWWADHQAKCGGTFVKIHEPDGFGVRKKKTTQDQPPKALSATQPTLNSFPGFKSPTKGKPVKIDVATLKNTLPKSPVKRQSLLNLTDGTNATSGYRLGSSTAPTASPDCIDLTEDSPPPATKKLKSLASFPSSVNPRRQLQLSSFFTPTPKPMMTEKVDVKAESNIVCID
ncbi:SprT-like domain-containing protein Spartan [Hypsibius exemplaris]|uniref:SprT-like domain-containing protein Spartan n=1 Tax=Hypsibius exemplaris TaxID=2072580 RepID=A0A1W0WX31_HYPEX|nr:SprT-like domain-containing protein Spartan [Hypsibius exemplaris]